MAVWMSSALPSAPAVPPPIMTDSARSSETIVEKVYLPTTRRHRHLPKLTGLHLHHHAADEETKGAHDNGEHTTSNDKAHQQQRPDSKSSHHHHRQQQQDGEAHQLHPDRSASPSRARTVWASLKYLSSLTPAQVDDFMASYVIYSLDWADPAAMTAALGPDYQTKVGDCLRAYYGVLNHLCALGDVEKMYIPPVMDLRASVRDNQLLFEEAVAREIGIAPAAAAAGSSTPVSSSGSSSSSSGTSTPADAPLRILDLGCGRGRVAAHMAAYSRGRAVVTGVNIDPNQVAQARSFNTAHSALTGRNEFVVQDFNDLPLPFADASFDGFYQIQAFSLCRDIPALLREVRRVLRPGARVSFLDWVSLPAYDPTNPEHAELMARVKPLIGAVGTPTPAGLVRDFEAAGFRVLKNENASAGSGGFQYPLIDRVDIYFRTLRKVVLGLVKVGAIPPHFRTLIDRLCLDGEAFVKMDRAALVTTSWWIVAERVD